MRSLTSWLCGLAAVVLVFLFPLALLAQGPPVAPGPAAPAPAGWLSPEGLNAIFALLLLLAPLLAGLLRRFEMGKLADKVVAVTADAQAYRASVVSVVQGVEAFRKRTKTIDPAAALELARHIEDASKAGGVQPVLDAIVQSVTAPGASVPTPAVAAALPPAADPVLQAVRGATGRLDPRRVG